MKLLCSRVIALLAMWNSLSLISVLSQETAPRHPVTQADIERRLELGRWTKLNGVKRILLNVEVDDDISHAVSKDQVQNDAELALRTRGLSVQTLFNGEKPDGWLSVTIRSIRLDSSGPEAVHVRVALDEDSIPIKALYWCANATPSVDLASDKLVSLITCADFYSVVQTVWDQDRLWILGKDKLVTARQSAKDLVDAFLIDWLKANEQR